MKNKTLFSHIQKYVFKKAGVNYFLSLYILCLHTAEIAHNRQYKDMHVVCFLATGHQPTAQAENTQTKLLSTTSHLCLPSAFCRLVSHWKPLLTAEVNYKMPSSCRRGYSPTTQETQDSSGTEDKDEKRTGEMEASNRLLPATKCTEMENQGMQGHGMPYLLVTGRKQAAFLV